MYTFLEQIAADHMTRDAKTVSRDLTLRELEDLFENDDFNAYPVEESSEVVGLVSKFDFLACFVFSPATMVPRYDDLMSQTVRDNHGLEYGFEIGPNRREVLLQGLDDIGQSLQHEESIDAYEEAHKPAACMYETVDVKYYTNGQ